MCNILHIVTEPHLIVTGKKYILEFI